MQRENSVFVTTLWILTHLAWAKDHITCGMTANCQNEIHQLNFWIWLFRERQLRSLCREHNVKELRYALYSYTVSNRQRLNKCSDHGITHNLAASGPCLVQIVYIWPEEDDFQRWMGWIPREIHNHMVCLPYMLIGDNAFKTLRPGYWPIHHVIRTLQLWWLISIGCQLNSGLFLR